MLNLSLDDLFGPEIVAAFQAQWAASPEAAEAQAAAAVRAIVKPRRGRERLLSQLLLALVGPEPDAFAWMEALAKGSFQLRGNVTYAIGRVGESPAKFIERQRQRIADLADHPRARGRAAEYRNAYNDALRLVVATTLLTQLRTGVAAKAAIGAGWPLMAAVTLHCTEEEKRALFWFGNDEKLQATLANNTRSALVAYQAEHPDAAVPRRADYDRRLPPGADVRAFFAPVHLPRFDVASSTEARRALPIELPAFLSVMGPSSETQPVAEMTAWRAQLLMSALFRSSSGACAFGPALRSKKRREMRDRWLDGDTDAFPPDFHIQSAVADHVRKGGFMPPDIPVEYVHYLEEDACYAFHEHRADWPGLEKWRRWGFFEFEWDETRLEGLDI